MISVGRDTSEPLADACLLGGLLAYRHRRLPLAAALIGYAVFTNEPVLVLPVGARADPALAAGRGGPGRGCADLAWLLPGLPVPAAAGHPAAGGARAPPGGVADASANLTWPFTPW